MRANKGVAESQHAQGQFACGRYRLKKVGSYFYVGLEVSMRCCRSVAEWYRFNSIKDVLKASSPGDRACLFNTIMLKAMTQESETR